MSTPPRSAPGAPVRPIIVGGDLGAYASARAFHEAFGVRSVVIAGVSTGAVAHSRIVDQRIVPGLDDDATLIASVLAVAAEDPRSRHLVLGSADWIVDALVAHRATLEPAVTVPYAQADVLATVGDKARLMARCAAAGVPHPATRVLIPGKDDHTAALGEYPQIVKPASTTAAHDVDYPGKRKVHVVNDGAELDSLLAVMARAGFAGPVLAQEHIPGGDEQMAAVNVFAGPDGAVWFGQLGQVLLEEHAPSALGNSVAQVTVDASVDAEAAEVVAQVISLLRGAGWSGFANVDLKRGADGVMRVLEVNPRVGRSGYAVTASGHNVARMIVSAYLEREAAPAEPVIGASAHLFLVVPWALLRRYVPAPERERAALLRRQGNATNPLFYRVERHPRRWAYLLIAMANQFRKFRAHHPRS